MKALVTGGTGFIGRQVVDLLLENGHAVRLLTRRNDLPEGWKSRDVALLPGDLREPGPLIEALDGVDTLYHIGEVRNTTAGNAQVNIRAAEQMAAALGPAG